MVRWKCESDKYALVSNFQKRGWTRCQESSKALFQSDAQFHNRLEPKQVVNHFPNQHELTRKDLLVKHVKRWQKQVKKQTDIDANSNAVDFIPVTYVLPQDYPLFAEQFKKNQTDKRPTWIMKPIGKAQGRGIFIINKLAQVKKWAHGPIYPTKSSMHAQVECYVVSKYIDKPILLGGKKFDLRLYVVVLSYRPLKVYMSNLGFARFCSQLYSSECNQLCDSLVHLTNVSIQKHGEDYNPIHGNKWPLENLKLYLNSIYGEQKTTVLFQDIDSIVVNSLKACSESMINDHHCFELYGYDIIIDEKLKPWLIEVNSSPSLSSTTRADRILKAQVIDDVLDVVAYAKRLTPQLGVYAQEQQKAQGRPATAGGEARHSILQSVKLVPNYKSLRLICEEKSAFENQRRQSSSGDSLQGKYQYKRSKSRSQFNQRQ